MHLTLTNQEVLDAFAVLVQLDDPELKWPPKLTYATGKNRRALRGLVDAIQESHQKLVRRHQREEDGKPVWKKSPLTGEEMHGVPEHVDKEAYEEEKKAFLAEENEIDLHAIDFDLLMAQKTVPQGVFAALDPIIVRKEKEGD